MCGVSTECVCIQLRCVCVLYLRLCVWCIYNVPAHTAQVCVCICDVYKSVRKVRVM